MDVSNLLERFMYSYSVTSQIMFPILVFIIILLIKDLGKYSKISEKINKKINDLCESIEDTGFKKEHNESSFTYISRYIIKKKSRN